MKELKVDPQIVEAKANQMNATREQVSTTMTDIKNEMDGLKASWISETASKTQTQFETAQADVQAMLNVIAEYSQDLLEVARIYKTTESESTQRAASLPTDIFG